jgi:hypothetical protein
MNDMRFARLVSFLDQLLSNAKNVVVLYHLKLNWKGSNAQ